MNKRILNKVANKTLSPKEGFDLLYGNVAKKARFIRIQFYFKDKLTLTYLLNSLFIFPIPIVFGKYFIKHALKKHNIPTSIYYELVNVARNASVVVNSKEADIYLYII